MKQIQPIVYAYEEEVTEFFQIFKGNDNKELVHKGVAFEWRNEYVFHAHTKFPNSTILGVPIISIFVFFPNKTLVENDLLRIKNIANEFINNGNEYSKNILIISFKVIQNQITKRAHIFNENESFECDVFYVPKKSELYSRSKGLLEIDALEKKTVAIIGLGSFGSYVSLELAKAGIGHFKLFDFDRIELSNIARHTCGVNDLGRYKTHAIRDLILQKNPFAKVDTFEININDEYEHFKSEASNSDILICLTDENRSRNMMNELGLELKKIVIFARAVTRAEGGDIFILHPTNPDLPCLACIVGSGLFSFANEEVSSLKQANRDLPAYTSESDVNATVQVGLSSDIAPICNMVVKLTLVELSKGIECGISSLEEDLVSNYYIWANRREKHYNKFEPMGYTANKLSILRWYGVRTKKDTNCMVCHQHH